MALTLPQMWALVELSDLSPARQSVVLSPPAGGGLREHWLGGVCPNSKAPRNIETSPGEPLPAQRKQAEMGGQQERRKGTKIVGGICWRSSERGEGEIPTVCFPDRQTVTKTQGWTSSPEENLSCPLSIPGQCSYSCLIRTPLAAAEPYTLWFHPVHSGHYFSTHSAWLRVAFLTLPAKR